MKASKIKIFVALLAIISITYCVCYYQYKENSEFIKLEDNSYSKQEFENYLYDWRN